MSAKTPAMKRPAASRKADPDRALAHLRAQVRAILLTEGTAVAPGSETPVVINDLIGELATRYMPTIDSASKALVDRVEHGSGRALACEVSDHHGSIMNAYGDAGYFVGVAAGLELAAVTFGGAVPVATKKRRGGR